MNRGFPKDSRSTYRSVPPRNVYERFDVRGAFFMGTQIPHGRHRPSRVGNNHRDNVTVFRFEVFDHHVDVHDVRIEVPEGVLPWCFVAAAEFEFLVLCMDSKHAD